LVAHLQRVAAVDEDRGAVGEHDRNRGRAGEPGEPGEPLFRWRQVFVLMAVGARRHEAGETAPHQLGAQRGDARRRCGAPLGIGEGLKKAPEHGRQSMDGHPTRHRPRRGGAAVFNTAAPAMKAWAYASVSLATMEYLNASGSNSSSRSGPTSA